MTPARAVLAALVLASSVGCTYRYQGEPIPQAPLTLPAKAPVAATAEILYRYDGNPWNGPLAWDQTVRQELEYSSLLGVAGLGRRLRVEVSREIHTPVWRYVAHWLTVFMFPRSAELTLTVRATLLGPQDVELGARQVSSSIEAQASLLFLFFPPAWASWSAAGSGHENPLILENVRGLTRTALSALTQDLAPRAQPLAPLPDDPDPGTTAGDPPPADDAPKPAAFCTECGDPVQASWKHCPACGTATRSGD